MLVAGFFFCQFKLKYMAVVFVGWLVACLVSQQHACGTQGQICPDNLTCCHIEIEAADQTFYLTQSQYTDTMPGGPDVSDSATGAVYRALLQITLQLVQMHSFVLL